LDHFLDDLVSDRSIAIYFDHDFGYFMVGVELINHLNGFHPTI